MNDYWLARLAGRLNWTYAQIKAVPLNVALLCERLGWIGSDGFERLQLLPLQTVNDWVSIAEMEREKEQKRASN